MSQFNPQGEARSSDGASYDAEADRTPYELVVMDNADLRARLQLADERAFYQAADIARLRARGDQALRTLRTALTWMESFKRYASIGDKGPLSYTITEAKQVLSEYKQEAVGLKNLLSACADMLVCIRDNPDFHAEQRNAARALMDCGVVRVCNQDLSVDAKAGL